MPGRRLLDCKREELQGLPVYRTDGGSGAGAALVFRVGQADETLPRRGVTHLVEHLVLAPATRSAGVSGHVDLLSTVLVRHGDPAEVAEWLQATAAALASLPTDRLETERSVLSVEAEGSVPPGAAVLLRLVYGARGPGLAAYEEVGLRAIRAPDVVEHARRWFCRSNAALVLMGDVEPPPLELPPGDRPAVPRHAPRALPALPAEAPQPGGPLALGAPMPDTSATAILASLLERRTWAALRHDRGLAYDVSCRARPVGPEERMLMLTTDVPVGDAAPAAEALVEQVRALAGGAIGDRDLDETISELELAATSAQPHVLLTAVASSELVRGRVRLPDEALAELRSTTPDQVVDAAASLSERMLVALPSGAAAGLPVVEPFKATPVDGRRFRRRRAPRHIDATDVIVGDEGVFAALDDGQAITVRYATCAAALREIDGGLTLIDEAGHVLTIDPGDLRDGAEAVAEAERKLDPSVLVGLDARAQRVQESARRPLRPWLVGEASELLAPLLGRDEHLLLAAEATQGLRSGALAVTDRRLLFVAKLLSEHVEEIPFASVTRVRARHNPLWPSLSIEHGNATTKISFMTVPRLKEAAAAVEEALRDLRVNG